MISFRLTPLLVLFVLIVQALCLDFVEYSDGSYGWRYIRQKTNSMSSSEVRDWAKSAYREMVSDANHRRKSVPSVMAALYVSNSRGRYIILASSIKGARGTSAATEDICSDQQ